MLGPASVHRLTKKAAARSLCTQQSARCFRVSAAAVDPNAQASALRQEDSPSPREARHVAACISAIAAQLITANVAWSDVPQDELFSLQAAQPLTVLSSDVSVDTSANAQPLILTEERPTLAAIIPEPSVSSISTSSSNSSSSSDSDNIADATLLVAVVAEEEQPDGSSASTTPSLQLASAPAFSSSSELAEAAVADVAAAAELVEPSKPFQIAADLAAETAETAETATPGALESDKSAAPALAATIVAAADDALAAVGADRPAVLAVVDTPAEPAVASPVVAMDIPAMPAINADTDVQTLVVALIRNEQFISALVNNEAFLDRLAGEDRVVEELARRKGLSVEVEARDELATELRRRQQMMDALAARGEEAVLAVADAAKRAAEEASAAARNETMEADVTGEVGVVSSGKSALVAMSAAVELLEDSQELLAAIEANPGSTPLSAIMDDDQKLQREMSVMEAAVARAENSVSKTLGKSAAEQLPAIQDAVRELYSGGEQQDEVAINRAYTDLVTAVAEMQRAYGTAISKAVGHAVAEVVEVEEAAIKGAEKTKVLLGQKVEELEKAVSFNSPATRRDAIITQEPATVATNTSGTNLTKEQDVEASGLKFAVVGAFLFWFWGTFVQPKSRYSR